jgi:hypothetical protein
VSRNRTRVRASRRLRTRACALMLRDAAQRGRMTRLACVHVRCAAPQHEGRRGRGGCGWLCRPLAEGGSATTTIFDAEGPTCGCRKRCVTRAPCFRPVIYREVCNRGARLGDATQNPGRGLPRRCVRVASAGTTMLGRARRQPASVENRRGIDSIVFGLFLTMEKTTRACEASAFAVSRRGDFRGAHHAHLGENEAIRMSARSIH